MKSFLSFSLKATTKLENISTQAIQHLKKIMTNEMFVDQPQTLYGSAKYIVRETC